MLVLLGLPPDEQAGSSRTVAWTGVCRRVSGWATDRVRLVDMLTREQITEAGLTDWRKLAQGLHARYLVDGFSAGARFVAAVGEAGDALGHHPGVSIGSGHVDLKLVSADAVYRDDEGTEHVVEWVTQQDVDLARRITEIAAEHALAADPAAVSVVELGLDTASSATIAPVWAVLLTGSAEAQGLGTPSDEVRDATGRVPNLWFGDADEDDAPRQRFHVEVYVAPEVAEQRIAAAVAAGGTVVDDSGAPSLTVIADQDGNTGVVCVAEPRGEQRPTGGCASTSDGARQPWYSATSRARSSPRSRPTSAVQAVEDVVEHLLEPPACASGCDQRHEVDELAAAGRAPRGRRRCRAAAGRRGSQPAGEQPRVGAEAERQGRLGRAPA